MQQKRCILKGFLQTLLNVTTKLLTFYQIIEWKGTGSPELFDVHLNEVLVHFYIAAGKPNGENIQRNC